MSEASEVNRPFVADRPARRPSSEALRQRIPGWSADLDPRDRPSSPRERFDPDATGAHRDLPERPAEAYPRERSIEHGILPLVCGTVAIAEQLRSTRADRSHQWIDPLLVAGPRLIGGRLAAGILRTALRAR